MSFLASLAGSGLFGIAGLLGKTLFGHKQAPLQTPPPVTRDAARDQLASDDALRRRRGSAADILNGTQGAEAAAGSTGRLVVGN